VTAAPEQDPQVSVTVPVPQAEAFRVFTERGAQWLPPEHRFLRDAVAVTMEPGLGGRFYERAADGREAVRGTLVAWDPPRRLAVTWRIGPGWRPLPDDERAPVIEVEFRPAGPRETEVTLTYTHLDGEMGPVIRSAVANAGPGSTLARYAAVAAGLG
jgi:uncharacterized protein YndB with AHSA1/START domain